MGYLGLREGRNGWLLGVVNSTLPRSERCGHFSPMPTADTSYPLESATLATDVTIGANAAPYIRYRCSLCDQRRATDNQAATGKRLSVVWRKAEAGWVRPRGRHDQAMDRQRVFCTSYVAPSHSKGGAVVTMAAPPEGQAANGSCICSCAVGHCSQLT